MASVEEHVCHINDGDGSFDGWWTYDNVSGDLLSVRWANTTPHAYNVRVTKGNNVNTFTIQPGSGSQAVPGKKYAFIQTPSLNGDLEWAPNFTFQVFRA